MGLPLYVPPVESDLRRKIGSAASTTAGPNTIRRARRRDTDALRDRRRRAILTAAAAYTNTPPDHNTDGEAELRRQEIRNLHESFLRSPAQPPLRELQRVREQDYAQMLVRRGIDVSTSNNANHDRFFRRFLDRIRQHDEEHANRIQEQADRLQEEALRLQQVADAMDADDDDARTALAAAHNGHNAWRQLVRSSLMSSVAGASLASGTAPRPNATAQSTPPVGGNSAYRGRGSHDNDANLGSATNPRINRFLAAADSPIQVHHREHADQPNHSEDPEQPPRPAFEYALNFDEADGDINARLAHATSRRARRRASSLRRVTNASGSSSTRRPTVGWTDGNSSDRSGPRPHGTSTSRIFGDISQIPGGAALAIAAGDRQPPRAPAARRHGWAARHTGSANDRSGSSTTANSSHGSRARVSHNVHLPSIHDLFGTAYDGLGDRQRSLSPEGDGVWDTLLTTLTPDPQPPSVNSSFASWSEALTAGASEDQAALFSSQPTVVPTPVVSAPPAVPSPGVRDEEAAVDHDSTPAPLLVEAPRLPNGPTHSASTGDAASAGASSVTTSANTSQPVRSPFTVVSAETDTADESVALGGRTQGEEEACGDSEMDEGGGEAMDDDDEADEEGEDEEEQASYLGLSTGPSAGLRYSRPPPRQTNMDEISHQFLHAGEDPDQSMRTSFESSGSGGTQTEDSSNGSSRHELGNRYLTEDTLDLLGIGGMQHIVRSLARREDIPDEWWAEAGLSRTLPPDASN